MAVALSPKRRTALRWTATILLAPGLAFQFGTPVAFVVGVVLAVLWWGRAAGLLALFLAVASLAGAIAKKPARAGAHATAAVVGHLPARNSGNA